MSLDMLSDYAWKVLAYLSTCAEGTASASDVAAFGNVGEDDSRFIFMQLSTLAENGLVQREREEMRGPWLWQVTDAGRVALDGRVR